MEEEPDQILIDIHKTDLTLGEVLARVEQYKKDPAYRGYEIFLDGDAYAIVARRKMKHDL